MIIAELKFMRRKPERCSDCDFCEVEDYYDQGWCELLFENVEDVSKTICIECPIKEVEEK